MIYLEDLKFILLTNNLIQIVNKSKMLHHKSKINTTFAPF